MTTWTDIAHATTPSWVGVNKPVFASVFSGGTPIGLLLALTQTTTTPINPWTDITKPSGTAWTPITKPS